MLGKTQTNLAGIQGKFQVKKFGVEEIPFDSNTFDAVIASHILYYAANLGRHLASCIVCYGEVANYMLYEEYETTYLMQA